MSSRVASPRRLSSSRFLARVLAGAKASPQRATFIAPALATRRTTQADFGQLQDDLKRKRYDRLAYYAFDLLHLDGFDVRGAPLIERKRILQAFLA